VKSITPVISVILLILITILASASAYFFIINTTSDLESNADVNNNPITDSSRLSLVSITGTKSIIRNDGISPVTEVVMFINGELLNFTLNAPLLPGEYKEINYSARQLGEDLVIKIIYNKGKSISETSPAIKNTEVSGFTSNPLPLNQEATCSVEFSDSTSPVIDYDSRNFESSCDPCLSSPISDLYLKVTVTDDSPIRDVIFENAGTNNFSLIPLGISGIYEITVIGASVLSGSNKVYATDWLNNTSVLSIDATPDINIACSAPACTSVEANPENFSFLPSSICFGENVAINASYVLEDGKSNVRTVLAVFNYPNSEDPSITEYVHLEQLDDNGTLFGAYYYPKVIANYEILLKSTSSSGELNSTILGTLIINE
jgi:hypothetical protein